MIKEETGEKREFSTGAKKQNAEGKGTPALFPGDAYLEISKHFEDGASTHGSRNWEKGIPLSELINSLERHIAQEKMGLTEESHDRALAWNAVVYLATKLRIKAGILPKELDDLEGAYAVPKQESENKPPFFEVFYCFNEYLFYITDGDSYIYWDHQMTVPVKRDFIGYFETEKQAQECLDAYIKLQRS